MLVELIDSWRRLTAQFGESVRVRYITTDFPYPADRICDGCTSSAAFLSELAQAPAVRGIAYWRTTPWAAFVEELRVSSHLSDAEFEGFLHSVEFRTGVTARPLDQLSPAVTEVRQARELASALQRLVASSNGRSRWTTSELLQELNKVAPYVVRRSHQFPIGQPFQPNQTTLARLERAIGAADSGYIALLGAPGVGKSTLLQSALNSGASMIVVRYYAYMPGETQGLGRAEADSFLEDINTQLKATGLLGHPDRVWDETRAERRERLEMLLRQAGERFRDHQVRTVIVVDGLDHIAREERPERSLVAELPPQGSLPAGVLVVLGSQYLELQDLPPAIKVEAAKPERCVTVDPLSREAVYRLAEQVRLPQHIDRARLYEVSQGHPLATRYLLEALTAAETDDEQAALLAGAFTFDGDLDRVYTSSWAALARDERAVEVIDYVARAEGYIDPRVIATVLSEAAVEHAYQTTRHLLTRDGMRRWRIFHNSFRLFVLGQRHERFGIPDNDYDRRIYQRLAELARGTLHDADGEEVAREISWRDAHERSGRADGTHGKGSLVLLTERGKRQLEALAGPLHVRTWCQRTWQDSSDKKSRTYFSAGG